MPRCIEDLIKETNGAISRDEATAIFNSIESRYKRLDNALKSSAGKEVQLDLFESLGLKEFTPLKWSEYAQLSPRDRLRELAKMSFAEELSSKQKVLHDHLQQIQINFANEVALTQHAAITGRTRIESTIDFMTGNPGGKGEMQSVQAHFKGIVSESMSRMWPGLENYLSFFGFRITRERQIDLVREVFEPGSTKDPAAKAMARVWREVSDDLRVRLNRAGADIGHITGYIPQSWDRMKTQMFGLTAGEKWKMLRGTREERSAIQEKARSAWVDYVLPRMDREHPKYINKETGEFMNDLELRGFLSNAWESIAKNGMNKTPEMTGGGPTRGVSPVSRLEAERQLHFKGAEVFTEANDLFGSSDIFSSIVQTVHSHSKTLALMEKFGRNTNTGFANMLTQAKHLDALEPNIFFDGKASFARTLFEEMNGGNNSPESTAADMVARISSDKRSWLTFSKLGSAFLSQPTDMVTFTSMAMHNGLGAVEAIKAMTHYLNPLNSADRAAAQRLGLALESAPQEVMSRFADTLSGSSLANKAANWVITASFMKYWTDAMKTAHAALYGQHLAMVRDIPFHDLEARFKQTLQRHGIDQGEWDTIRQTELVELGGRQLIVPSRVADRSTAIKLFGMFADEGDVAVLSPDFKERALAKGNSKPGSPWGEIRKDVLLFRTYSIGMLTKILPRIVASAPEGAQYSRAQIATTFAIGTVLAGAFNLQNKEISKGRNPRDMTDPGFWAASAMQSGGLGLYGDFFFADYNRFGGGFAETVGGPVAGLLGDVMKVTVGNLREAADGDKLDAGAEAIKFAKNYMVPNLWYTRAALDHLLFYRLQESVNPGYLGRMKRRVEKQNDQSFWWNPEDQTPEGPPDLSRIAGR